MNIKIPRKLLIWSALLSTTLFIGACGRSLEPETSCNFVQNSSEQRVSWGTDLPVKMYIHSSMPNEYVSAIYDAADEWNLNMNKQMIKIEMSGIGGTDQSIKDGYSIISYINTWDPEKVSSEQARTTVFWRGTQIKEADIKVNSNFSYSVNNLGTPGKVDIYSLMVHEFGHVLGLAHIETAGSVMVPELSRSEIRRTPKIKDIDSLSCEYI